MRQIIAISLACLLIVGIIGCGDESAPPQMASGAGAIPPPPADDGGMDPGGQMDLGPPEGGGSGGSEYGSGNPGGDGGGEYADEMEDGDPGAEYRGDSEEDYEDEMADGEDGMADQGGEYADEEYGDEEEMPPDEEGEYPGGFPGAGRGAGAAAAEPATLIGKAERALMLGKEKEAFNYLYASALAEDDSDVVEKYMWVNALKQPTLAVRWGIGIHLTVGKDFQGSYFPIGKTQNLADRRNQRGRGGRGGRESGGGEFGAPDGGGGYDEGSGMEFGGPEGQGAQRGGGSKLLTDATGELGDEVVKQLTEKIANGDYGEILLELAEARPAARPGGYPGGGGGSGFPGSGAPTPGAAGFGGGAGGFPGGGSGFPDSGYDGGEEGDGEYGSGAARGAAAGAGGTLVPGLTVLGEGTSKELLEAAGEQGIDVLVFFDVKVEKVRKTGLTINETKVGVWSVAKRKELRKTKLLRNTVIELARADAKDDDDDPVKTTLDRLFEPFFTDEAPGGDDPDLRFKMCQLPQGILPQHVKGRVDAILASESAERLPVLAEIKFFHHRGLLDDETFTKSFQTVLGETEGAKLAEGKEEERLEVVETLLPQD